MPRIDVNELREYAAGLRTKGEELRGRTSHISQMFLGLADNNSWNDARYSAFQLKFEEKTLRAAEFADRIEQYAEWIQRLANDVEERWGETMNVN
jgi:hypothetical protein